MALKGSDKEFRLAKISYVDYKHIDIDRTLLNLFPRLRYDGRFSRARSGERLVSVERFADEFTDSAKQDRFPGFQAHRHIVEKWLETDLLDLVNRGKPNQAVVAPRPLHGNTYKYRNTKHARDYSTSDQVYWMLYHARGTRGQAALEALKRYVFEGLDLNTDRVELSAYIDVETQAILHLPERSRDQEDSKRPDIYPPLCLRHADMFAEDVLRLLAYERHMPRTVLIEYLKTLLAFHLALYHLKIMKLLPALVKSKSATPLCGLEQCPAGASPGACAYTVGLMVDCTGGRHAHMARLAGISADVQYRRIPAYIEAQFVVKKLDEMALEQQRLGRLSQPVCGYFRVEDLLRLLTPAFAEERKRYFEHRLLNLLSQTPNDQEQPPEYQQILNLRLPEFDTFIEILVVERGAFHRRYITQCLDSLLQKNAENGLLRQSRAKGSPRQFSLGSRLLELLLQLAVLTPESGRFRTHEIRVDTLLTFLRERYGLHIDTLPAQDGFDDPSILDRQALRRNSEAFKERLRDIGYFQDLSDAYISQIIAPRYTIA